MSEKNKKPLIDEQTIGILRFKVGDKVVHNGEIRQVLSAAISPISHSGYYFISKTSDFSEGQAVSGDELKPLEN